MFLKIQISGDNIAGIYAIANIETAKIYIGSSNNVKTRTSQHKNLLKKGKEVRSLQHDYDSGAAFVFFQLFDLKDCCQEKQYFYEQCYIIAFKQSSLYNKSRGVIRAGYKKGFMFLLHKPVANYSTSHIRVRKFS